MSNLVRLTITREDIEIWRRDQTHDPILQALIRATQTPWRLIDINRAIEKVAPYRCLILRSDILMRCRKHLAHDEVEPFEFETELISPFRN